MARAQSLSRRRSERSDKPSGRAPDGGSGRGPDVAQTVVRTARVLGAFTETPTARVSDLARRLGLPKTVVHRTLVSLTTTGLLTQDPASRVYRLGPEAVALGHAAVESPGALAAARPIMQELRNQTGETVTLSLLIGRERVYVAQ